MAAAGPNTPEKDLMDVYGGLDPKDEDLDRIAEANDLFDAVLTGSVDQDKNTTNVASLKDTPDKDKEKEKSTQIKTPKGTNSLKRLSLYIGNFSWWTSDKDLVCMAQRLGVKDIAEIKFAENKVNGQSRGYAEMVVTSEESLKTLLEKIPQCKLNGERIDCRFATRQNLTVFEDIASKRIPLRVNSKDAKESDSLDKIPSLLSQEHSTPPIPPLFPSHPLGNRFPSLPSSVFLPPPSQFPHMPQPVPPPMPPFLFPPHPALVPSQPSPSLHINPAFFNPAQDGHSSKAYSQQKQTPQSTDGDFEELMNRNKVIASSAITKAVSGATAGDMRVAMETLLTAIAIIKQSRVYGDERCKALVTSLKDCLVSIQGNCGYSSRSTEKDRDRDRGRDRERERERERDRERDRDRDRDRNRERDRDSLSGWDGAGMSRRHRDRSWSGEKDKEHSRERERHRDHRDRYR